MKKLWLATLYVLLLVAVACSAPEVVAPSPTPAATQTPAPQAAAGEDPNPYTAAFAAAFCAQDAQGVYDALANGSNLKDGYVGQAEYYATLIDQQTQAAAIIVVEAGKASDTDVTAMLKALDVNAAALKAQNSPVAILAADIKLPDATTCTMTFKASFTSSNGSYEAIYVVTYTSAEKTWGNFFVLEAGNGGVEGIQ